MKYSKKTAMYERITNHGEQLKKIFNLPINTDPVKLCHKLHRIEYSINKIMCNLCNTNNLAGFEPHYENGKWIQIENTEEEQDKVFDSTLKRVKILLSALPGYQVAKPWSAVFLNHDPRGYTLKIKDTAMIENGWKLHTDMGGYGIIAPDLTEGI